MSSKRSIRHGVSDTFPGVSLCSDMDTATYLECQCFIVYRPSWTIGNIFVSHPPIKTFTRKTSSSSFLQLKGNCMSDGAKGSHPHTCKRKKRKITNIVGEKGSKIEKNQGSMSALCIPFSPLCSITQLYNGWYLILSRSFFGKSCHPNISSFMEEHTRLL